MRNTLGCFIFLMMMITSHIFAGTVYYVDATNGNDLNDGLFPAAAWKTISKVNSTSFNPGDIIQFKRGETWSGTMLTCDNSGTDADNMITYQDYGSGNKPILKNPPGTNTRVVRITADWVKVKNFDLKDAHGEGVRFEGANNIVEYCEISDVGEGISFRGQYNLAQYNYIHDTHMVVNTPGGDDDYGATGTVLYNGSSNSEICYNTYYRCRAESYDYGYDGGALEFFVSGTVSNIKFHHNWIEGCNGLFESGGSGGSGLIENLQIYHNVGSNNYSENSFCFHTSGTFAVDHDNIQVYNNTFVDTHDYASPKYTFITFGAGTVASDFLFRNNIFYLLDWSFICHSDSQGWNWTHEYNCHYIPNATRGFSLGTGEIGQDPKFVDVNNGDYHLEGDSPCIDVGTDLSLTQDYDGNPVPSGYAPDIGAYEYQGFNPLNANIIASPSSGEVPLTVNFTGSATGGTSPYTYNWNFGDGTSSSEQNPSHTYSQTGDYTITLTVTDSESSQDTDSLTINASDPVVIPLEVSFIASPTSGEVPLTVNFAGSATGGTEPYTYSWDFGDGASSGEQNPSHTYSQAGDYTVTLTVTDNDSNQDSDSLSINATDIIMPLAASFIASPTSGEVPLTVNFTGSATGGTQPYTYSWDFGDSTSSSEQNPSHTYSEAGDYTVTLTVTDTQTNQDTDSLTINASAISIPLEASFIASPTSGEAPLTINFTGSATGGTEPYSYSWDFGDSTSSSEQNPSHTYNDASDYAVYLTVTDSESNQDNDSLTINASAPATPLEASCAASPTSGKAPLTVNFTGSATGGVLPYSYNWDFGDSTSSSEQNPTHTYSDPGDYTVTLTVTDSQSNQDNDSLIINVSVASIPLEASCAASPTSGEVPLTINFTGNASGGTPPYSYSWDFGDGTSSSKQIPTHTYSDAGDYTVILTVTDSESNQDNDSLIINASALTNPLVASCAASPSSGEVPLTVNFTESATGGVLPYSFSWDFGDGTSSSEQNPSHIYSQAGDYTAYLTVTDSESNQDNDSLIINASAATNSAYLSCSPNSLYFGATTSGNETTDQYLRIINAGGGTLTWNIEDDADWLSCSPSSGTDRGEITVSVNASGLSLGLYIATITVSSPEAYNSPQYVSVNFRVYEPEQESPPFGSLDTPVNGSTVSGSIPITGWALDDIEVVRLEIKRNSDPLDPPEAIGLDGLVYIGDAVFVEGARPDVEKSYADYPLNSRAGWGYMLLTNDLPYRGNGSFTIYTFAYDAGGQREEIGRKTILCDNINSVKPFGTIDTREQGESIRGNDYVNFGWALTPLPKTIPKDGSTISVWIDGVQVGHPVYDQYREDIATLYPEYNNAQGAVGYYYLDTTQYENGMHTIAWSVMDDEGEADEIGARYFFIDNVETASVHHGSLGLRSIYREDAEGRLGIGIKEVGKEYRPQDDSDREINTKSILKIQIEEMEPLRIVLEESSGGNMEYIGWGENRWKALPIGSTLDREKGIFSWIPTPGFIGSYVLHFAVTDGSYMSKPLRVVVNVTPKSYD